MAGINNLREIYEKKGDDFLNQLLNYYVIINEKIDGTFFGLKKTKDDSFKYFKKSGEITYVDRVLMKYFNPAISYFESMSEAKRQRIPSNFYFGFQYFTKGDSKSIRRLDLPKNGLMLSYIHKLNDNGEIASTIQNSDQLNQWADYLGVDRPPIFFEGRLDDEQKTEILDFVYSNQSDLEKKFKTVSFTKYVFSILCPDKTEDLNDRELDTLIFRFYDAHDTNGPTETSYLAKIVDPLIKKEKLAIAEPPKNNSQDYIWLIVIDLMNHFEMYDLDHLTRMASIGNTYEEKYLSLINQIFKDFIKEYSTKYEGLQIELPEYLNRPEFNLETALIKDKEVLKLVKADPTYSEIYKILLNFFRKIRRKSSSNFFNDSLLTQLNLIVAKIKNIILGDAVYEGLFPSFSEFVGEKQDLRVYSEKEYAEESAQKKEKTKVNLLIGKFQPISNGHIQAAKKMKDSNGNKCILICIKPDGQTKSSPFSEKMTRKLLEKVQQNSTDILEDVKIIRSGQIEDILEILSEKYMPVIWGTSERQIKDYAVQFEYVNRKNIPLRISKDFKLVQLPSYVKSEDLLKTIVDSDFNQFKKLVPACMASEFFNLQGDLHNSLKESINA